MTLLLMLVAVLPWHAYAVAQSARLTAGAMQNVETFSATDHHAASSAPRPATAFAQKKCRIATLPGFSCAPDPAIHPAQGTGGLIEQGQVIRHSDSWRAESAATKPPIGPPRSI